MSSASVYRDVIASIPPGETRTYLDVAVLAGRPGAARAVGRVVNACPARSALPWHRVVASNGALARDPERAELQLARLRREGARPRAGESLGRWAERRGHRVLGFLPERTYTVAGDARGARRRPLSVEGFANAADALARGFTPIDGPAPVPVPEVPRRSSAARRARVPLATRLGRALDADALARLRRDGLLCLERLLAPAECDDVLAAARAPDPFERTIEMRPKGYGVGIYHYWREPLPAPLLELRAQLYALLRPLATELAGRGFPPTLPGFWRRCRAAGQRRASSILLRYGAGGVNHPHRDLYGRELFPLQALVLLAERARDFDGGEFVLIGDDDRRLEVPATRGDVVLFQSRLRHAANPVRRGARFAAGLVFNLAN